MSVLRATGADRPEPGKEISKEAKIVGLHGFSTPTLEAVDRRRAQLWTVAISVIVCLSVAVALLTGGGRPGLGFTHQLAFRVGTVALVIGLAAYVIEKERHLRRLSRLLVGERVLSAALSSRVKELASLYEAGKALNAILELEDLLARILSCASELLGAASGSIMMYDEAAGELVVVSEVGLSAARGARVPLGSAIAGRVGSEREPLLIRGQVSPGRDPIVDSAVSVPLIHRGELLGVLNLNGRNEQPYTEHDLRAVSLFAEQAAVAIANSRLYERERKLAEELSRQILSDPLTGEGNRVRVQDHLTRAIAEARQVGRTVGVLFVDLDDFKAVNDQLGHQAGDLVLVEVATRLRRCVRPSDTVGRMGGDEFVIVCEGLSGANELSEIALRVQSEFARPFSTQRGEVCLRPSVGLAAYDGTSRTSPSELIHQADLAMYRAKASKAAVAVAPVGRAGGTA